LTNRTYTYTNYAAGHRRELGVARHDTDTFVILYAYASATSFEEIETRTEAERGKSVVGKRKEKRKRHSHNGDQLDPTRSRGSSCTFHCCTRVDGLWYVSHHPSPTTHPSTIFIIHAYQLTPSSIIMVVNALAPILSPGNKLPHLRALLDHPQSHPPPAHLPAQILTLD